MQHAVDEVQRAVGARRKLGIVRDDDEARARAAVQLEHEVEHVAGGASVEVAGRLVGEHARRLGDQRARQRHALALTAGQLTRAMRGALGEPDALEQRPRPGAGRLRRFAPDVQRHGDVLERAELGQEMMELVDETERAVAHASALRLAQLRHRRAVDEHLAGAWRIEAAEQMQQRALARPRRADHGDALTGRYAEIDPHQHRHVERSAVIGLGQCPALEHRHGSHS